jgi:maltose/maltodextrin transport system substrate-binding protein
MNTLRKLSVFALIAIIAVVGLGISSNNTAKAQTADLTIWHSWQDAEGDLIDAQVEKFMEDTGLQVETRFIPFDDLRPAYETAAATGEGPDLLIGQADWAGGFHEAGLALVLNDEIAGTELESNLTEAAWNLMGFEGNRYGVPVTLDGMSLYYNRDFIDDEDVPTTLEDLLEVGVELTSGEDLGLIFPNGFYQTAGIYFGLGGQLFDEEGNNLWNTDDAAVKYLEAHIAAFEASDLIYRGEESLFQDGRAAMSINGSWNLNTYREALGDKLGVAMLPDVGEDMPWRPFFGGKGYYVNANTAHTDAALQFLTFVTSADGLTMGVEIAGHIPPTDAVEVDDELIAGFAAQFALGVALPTSPAMNAYWGPCGDAIVAVTERGESPEDAAAVAEATIIESLGGE